MTNPPLKPDNLQSLPHSPMEGGGIQRTIFNCTNCRKEIIAELDYDIDGNHIVECPHCQHEHCRTIKKGKVTDHRWSSKPQRSEAEIKARRVWKSSVVQVKTSSASHFLRERWLNREDVDLR